MFNPFEENNTYCGYCKCDPCRCTNDLNGDWAEIKDEYTDENGNPIEINNRQRHVPSAELEAARASRSHERPQRPVRQ